MTVERKKIFAGLTINANLREYERLGEISEFIHEVADVFVDDEAKTLTVVSKESVPIEKGEIEKLIGISGFDFAQAAAKGHAAVNRMAQLEARLAETEPAVMRANELDTKLKQTEDALASTVANLTEQLKQANDSLASARVAYADLSAERDDLFEKVQRLSKAIG